jgi:hypothetical protein
MPGPFSSDQRVGADGPPSPDSHPSELIPPVAAYPGPPPMHYPAPRHRRWWTLGAAVALVVVAVVAGATLYGSRSAPKPAPGAFTDATATAAIQGYLDALEHRDTETIARNALCGIYDAVRDRRSDQALAKLSSDVFRKQFSQAQVTSIDKIVYWSDYQAQVLFSMRIQRSTGSSASAQVQGVAQLISQHNQILVCTYVMRTAGKP